MEANEANNTNVESLARKLKTLYAVTPRVLLKVNMDSQSAASLGADCGPIRHRGSIIPIQHSVFSFNLGYYNAM